ncbi:MAG: o-succinylbenzoate synthase [Cyanobacteria bacterium]|nr:o-succinylbenzoate synthase [Cyanobacteria bacterium bin.51]
MKLQWRPFRFQLPRPLITASGSHAAKRGWLLRLEAEEPAAAGQIGWGEASPLEADPAAQTRALAQLEEAISGLGERQQRQRLEAALTGLPAVLGFAIGAALAEIDGQVGAGNGGWLPAPPSAVLLPAGEAAIEALAEGLATGTPPLTLKWKVAAAADALEQQVLATLLQRLPASAKLRLDANGGWDRQTAGHWAQILAPEPRLEWLEQPLEPTDAEGHQELAAQLPLALDESLRHCPSLYRNWSGWQVRRPALEGDPRPLLAQLQAGSPRLMLSTAFETGIGRRWLNHLAALQQQGPTPSAPGLAPGWSPAGGLFSSDPQRVWAAAQR